MLRGMSPAEIAKLIESSPLRARNLLWQLIDKEDLKLVFHTHETEEAVEYVTKFYRNFHSARYIRDLYVIRIKNPISRTRLNSLNRNFKDILKKGKIVQYMQPFEEEMNDPHTLDFPRLAFYFNRHHFSRLNTLIHEINQD